MQENSEAACSDANINFKKIALEVGGLKGGTGADVRSVKNDQHMERLNKLSPKEQLDEGITLRS